MLTELSLWEKFTFFVEKIISVELSDIILI